MNNSSTIFGTQSISNLATGGNIGTAANTVDIATSFNVNQTTTGQTITLPSPTDTTAGRIAYIQNIGSTKFAMLGGYVPAGGSLQAIWNGSAWTRTGGADGVSTASVNRSKTVSEGVTNSAVLQNDDDLYVTVAA
jgi:hypothetical protein